MPVSSIISPRSAAGPDYDAVTGTLYWFFYSLKWIVPLGVAGVLAWRAMRRLKAGERKTQTYDRLCLALLLAIGIGLAVWIGQYTIVTRFLTPIDAQFGIIFAYVLLATLIIAPLKRWTEYAATRVNAMSDRQSFVVAIAMALAVAIYLPVTAVVTGRSFLPVIHDELSYAVMAQIYASGHLWMPPHPLGPALENFYVFAQPVYGSMYFPGTGFLLAIPVLLGVPMWTASVAATGVFVATVFRIIAKLFSPFAAFASVAALLSVTHFRWLSTHLLSHVPLMAAVALGFWWYLRWKENHQRRWLVAFAITAGFATITRPYDAILVLLPPALDILIQLARQSRRQFLAGVSIFVLCAVPYVGLQMTIDRAFTGSYLKTPFTSYFEQDMPNAGFGYHPADPAVGPVSTLAQKIDFYKTFCVTVMNDHRLSEVVRWPFIRERLKVYYGGTFCKVLALALFPLGLVAATRKWYWAFAVPLPLFLVGYVPYPYFLVWYWASTILASIVIFWSAWPMVARVLGMSADRLQRSVAAGLLVAGVAVQPVWWPVMDDQKIFESQQLITIDKLLQKQVQKPAIVFFSYQTSSDALAQHEPTYNYQTAWPDDAPIIRVNSLSRELDLKTLHYYARQNANRHVYVYNRRHYKLLSEGTIAQFLSRVENGPTTQATTQPTAN